MDPWLKSDQSHERRRAVQSIALLLKCVVDYMKFTVSLLHLEKPAPGGRLARQVGRRRGGAGSPVMLCLCVGLVSPPSCRQFFLSI